MEVRLLLSRAQKAARRLRTTSADRRDAALLSIADRIERNRDAILSANRLDLSLADTLPAALRDRLLLDETRVSAIARAVREVSAQPDPLAATRELGQGRSGIRVMKKRVPLGVIAIVYEARPNVTAECAALTIKSGNAVVLRGGKEALESNKAVARAVREGVTDAGLEADAVQLVEDTRRETVIELLEAAGQIDLLIPRGGAGLMELVDAHARVPVVRHGQGICHAYVDERASAEMAVAVAFNSKVQRPGVCNAMETLIVHQSRLDDVLVPLGRRLADAGVTLRCDVPAQRALEQAGLAAEAARDEDWDTEFLSLVLAVRTVGSLDDALDHIADHGTHHTATIVTEDDARARRFLDEVDASCVLWNASTRFNDGGELGLGAEMGISTSKMHAYGPMSANELTAEKLIVYGNGQVRGSNG